MEYGKEFIGDDMLASRERRQTAKANQELLDLVQDYVDQMPESCSCHTGNPPCSWCTDRNYCEKCDEATWDDYCSTCGLTFEEN